MVPLKKEERESLIVEYQVLNDGVNRRYRDLLRVESTMIPSTLVIVTFAFIYRKEFGMIFGLPISGFIPLVSLIIVIVLYLQRWTTKKINDLSFGRIREIEKLLHIKGHRYIREQTTDKMWFKVRWAGWHVIFILLICFYLFTAFWLFWKL